MAAVSTCGSDSVSASACASVSVSQQPNVFVVGDSYVDVVAASCPRLPFWGGDVNVPSISLHCGGSGGNTSVNLAALGLTTRFLTALGDDDFGKFMHAFLRDHNVDSKETQVFSKTPTGTCMVISGPSDRGFVSCGGANVRLTSEYLWSRRTQLAHAHHVHFTGYFTLPTIQDDQFVSLLQLLRTQGVSTSLDPQSDSSDKWTGKDGNIFKVLAELDYFFPSEHEAMGISERKTPDEAAEVLAKHMRLTSILVIKCGSEGCRAYRHGKLLAAVPALPIAGLVDTTGCGDAFDSGFLASLLWAQPSTGSSSGSGVGSVIRHPGALTIPAVLTDGSSHTASLTKFQATPALLEALQAGNAAGAIRCGIMGGSDHAPSTSAIRAYLDAIRSGKSASIAMSSAMEATAAAAAARAPQLRSAL